MKFKRSKMITSDIESYVKHFGEQHRNMITDALKWLDETEPKWKLDKIIDRAEYIRNLVKQVAKDNQ